MRRKGTFGDHLTLTALAREYNAQIYVHSTRGAEGNQLVSNSSVLNNIQPLLHLGYFPEGEGEHYVSLNIPCLPSELHDFISDGNLTFDNRDELFDTTDPYSSEADNENIFEEVNSTSDD